MNEGRAASQTSSVSAFHPRCPLSPVNMCYLAVPLWRWSNLGSTLLCVKKHTRRSSYEKQGGQCTLRFLLSEHPRINLISQEERERTAQASRVTRENGDWQEEVECMLSCWFPLANQFHPDICLITNLTLLIHPSPLFPFSLWLLQRSLETARPTNIHCTSVGTPWKLNSWASFMIVVSLDFLHCLLFFSVLRMS